MEIRDYGPFAYSPITSRPPLRWPNDARLAVWVVPNIEFFSLSESLSGAGGQVPDVPNWSVRDYGNRIGVFRLMEVMSRYRIRGTVALNSDLCAHHPQIIEAARELDWEFMGHNESNTRRLTDVPAEDEPRVIRDTLSVIEKASGVRPAGWLSSGLQQTWNTLDHLIDNGVKYVCDWVNDDQPYLMSLEGGRKIVSMPYSYDVNDKPVFERKNMQADAFRDIICRSFDVLYREGEHSGRVMCIAVHPYLVGRPYRIDAFASALEYMAGHDKVWFATGSEIARHCHPEVFAE